VCLAVLAVGLGLSLAASPAQAADDQQVVWEEFRSKEGTLRRATFAIGDASCAYTVMAEPLVMGRLVRHVKKLVVHRIAGNFQDISIYERFFLVGNVRSRFHRVVNGHDRVEWELIAGRQSRHDGFWQVERLAGGGQQVVFENLISAKYSIHQGLLRRIQERTMSEIVDALSAECRGEQPTRDVRPSRATHVRGGDASEGDERGADLSAAAADRPTTTQSR
jgi:hypothetical protein